jgi:hypothetical protein
VVVDLVAPSMGGELILVAAREALTPADAQRVLGPKLSLLQRISSTSSA